MSKQIKLDMKDYKTVMRLEGIAFVDHYDQDIFSLLQVY